MKALLQQCGKPVLMKKGSTLGKAIADIKKKEDAIKEEIKELEQKRKRLSVGKKSLNETDEAIKKIDEKKKNIAGCCKNATVIERHC